MSSTLLKTMHEYSGGEHRIGILDETTGLKYSIWFPFEVPAELFHRGKIYVGFSAYHEGGLFPINTVLELKRAEVKVQ